MWRKKPCVASEPLRNECVVSNAPDAANPEIRIAKIGLKYGKGKLPSEKPNAARIVAAPPSVPFICVCYDFSSPRKRAADDRVHPRRLTPSCCMPLVVTVSTKRDQVLQCIGRAGRDFSSDGLAGLWESRNPDTAIHLAPTRGCAALCTLLNPASAAAASAAISARALFQPLNLCRLLWIRQRLIRPLQGST